MLIGKDHPIVDGDFSRHRSHLLKDKWFISDSFRSVLLILRFLTKRCSSQCVLAPFEMLRHPGTYKHYSSVCFTAFEVDFTVRT